MTSNINIEEAFSKRPDLKRRIYNAIDENVSLESLFLEISKFIQEINLGNGVQLPINSNGPVSKKRKLDESGDWKAGTYKAVKDISFSIPQRKKLTLEIGNFENQGLRVRNPTSSEIEFAIDWAGVEHILCLPLPEKAQAQCNFCIFPLNNSGISAPSAGSLITEQMLWTVPETAPKPGVLGAEIDVDAEDTYKTILLRLLNERLEPFKKRVIQPNEKEFASQSIQAHRKGEKAVHVKAFRGSKDGFLFFLPTGIAWVFKKPLIFFAFSSISAISYTSVLQRTFNLNLAVQSPIGDGDEPDAAAPKQEFEFSMIDQADFAGIDTYVRRHGLQDASMAEQRRAKKLNVNGVKEGDEEEGAEGELEKATREAQDMEDEEEEEEDENFDPGSEGESEGSGSSSEVEGDEGADEEEEEEEEKKGKDLVKDELGSEAEDMSEDE